MREALDGNTLFNTIAMARQSLQSLILVVEGPDDHFILNTHNTTDLYLLPGVGGKPNVLRAAALAERRGITGVRFLVDTDYDMHLDPNKRYPSNVIPTEHHDLTMDVIVASSRHLDRVIAAHSRSAERRGTKIDPERLREQAMKLASRLAIVRIANEKHSLGLRLESFPFGKLKSLEPTDEAIADIVVSRSKTGLDSAGLVAILERETEVANGAELAIVGDHDFFRALSSAMRMLGITVSSDVLWSSFLSAVTCEPIMKMDLYDAVSAWSELSDRTAFSCPCAA